MESNNYGLYLAIGISFVWIIGVGAVIIDMIIRPKKHTMIKQTKQPSYSQTHNSKKEDDDAFIIDDVSFPI